MEKFKILNVEEVKKLNTVEKKAYIESRKEFLETPFTGEVHYFTRDFYKIKNGELVFDLLSETLGINYELKKIKTTWWGWVGDNTEIIYYLIGKTQQIFIHRKVRGGMTDERDIYSFTTVSEFKQKEKAEREEKAEKKRFKLNIKNTLRIDEYSYKNPKKWDGKLDNLLKAYINNAPEILFFKNKAQYFCAATFETKRKVHQGGNEWLAVSTFTPHGSFAPKPKGELMLFSRYNGGDNFIPNIYKGNVESIDLAEFADGIGISEEECTKKNLFPSWNK